MGNIKRLSIMIGLMCNGACTETVALSVAADGHIDNSDGHVDSTPKSSVALLRNLEVDARGNVNNAADKRGKVLQNHTLVRVFNRINPLASRPSTNMSTMDIQAHLDVDASTKDKGNSSAIAKEHTRRVLSSLIVTQRTLTSLSQKEIAASAQDIGIDGKNDNTVAAASGRNADESHSALSTLKSFVQAFPNSFYPSAQKMPASTAAHTKDKKLVIPKPVPDGILSVFAHIMKYRLAFGITCGFALFLGALALGWTFKRGIQTKRLTRSREQILAEIYAQAEKQQAERKQFGPRGILKAVP